MKLDGKRKWYFMVGSFIALCGIASVVPNKKNQFEEALNVLSEKEDINKNQLEVVTASHHVLFLFHTVSLEVKVEGGKSIQASFKKIPFGNYYISKLEIL